MSESVPNRAGHEKRSDLYGPLQIANQWFDVMSAHNARMDEPKPRTAQEAMDIVGGYHLPGEEQPIKSQANQMVADVEAHEQNKKDMEREKDTGYIPNKRSTRHPDDGNMYPGDFKTYLG